MQVIKITRPTYVGVLGPMIQKYYERVNIHRLANVSYESFYTYIANVVQFGGNVAEFWVAFKDEQPVGFALWRVMMLPYMGTVYCEHLFKSIKDHEVALKLAQEFIEFGKRNKAPYYQFDAINDVVAKILRKLASEINVDLIETGSTTFVGRIING